MRLRVPSERDNESACDNVDVSGEQCPTWRRPRCSGGPIVGASLKCSAADVCFRLVVVKELFPANNELLIRERRLETHSINSATTTHTRAVHWMLCVGGKVKT